MGSSAIYLLRDDLTDRRAGGLQQRRTRRQTVTCSASVAMLSVRRRRTVSPSSHDQLGHLERLEAGQLDLDGVDRRQQSRHREASVRVRDSRSGSARAHIPHRHRCTRQSARVPPVRQWPMTPIAVQRPRRPAPTTEPAPRSVACKPCQPPGHANTTRRSEVLACPGVCTKRITDNRAHFATRNDASRPERDKPLRRLNIAGCAAPGAACGGTPPTAVSAMPAWKDRTDVDSEVEHVRRVDEPGEGSSSTDRGRRRDSATTSWCFALRDTARCVRIVQRVRVPA